MNKKELLTTIRSKSCCGIDLIDAVLKALTDVIAEELKDGGEIRLQDFGTFKSEPRPPRQGRNPQTGQLLTIPAKTVVKFKPANAFKEAIQ